MGRGYVKTWAQLRKVIAAASQNFSTGWSQEISEGQLKLVLSLYVWEKPVLVLQNC